MNEHWPYVVTVLAAWLGTDLLIPWVTRLAYLLGKVDKPILLFWGRQDTTVPFDHSQVLCAAIPNVKFHIIENCGHIPHYEKPELVNPILLEFLRQP